MTLINGWLRYSWAMNLALVALLSVASARTLNAYVAGRAEPARAFSAPAPATKPAQSAAAPGTITERDLFDVRPLAPAAPSAAPSASPAAPLALKLRGVVIFEPGGANNLASIQDLTSHRIALYLAGDAAAGATLVEIQTDRVVLSRNGVNEELKLEDNSTPTPAPPAIKPRLPQSPSRLPNAFSRFVQRTGENEYRVAREGIDRAIADNAFLNDGGIVPNFSGAGPERKLRGYQVIRVRPAGVYEALGLQRGDLITAINGQSPDPADGFLSLLPGLRQAPRLSLTVERNGAALELQYDIE